MDLVGRDGSLLRKKQQKWTKEKEDHILQQDWFPFGASGSPGGGNPNKIHEAKDYSVGIIPEKHSRNVNTEKELPFYSRCPADAVLEAMEGDLISRREKASANLAPIQSPIPSHFLYAPHAQPIPLEYLQNYESGQSLRLVYPPIPVPFHMIPPGAIPIPPPNQPSLYTDQWTDNLIEPSASRPLNVVYPMFTGADSLSTTTLEGSSDWLIPSMEKFSSVKSLGLGLPRKKTISDMAEELLEEQALEKQKRDELLAKYETELENKAAREQFEREERRRQLIEKRDQEEREFREECDRNQRLVMEAIEKAKKESALTKKAKLYNHVLANASPEMKKKLLGVENVDEGDRVLKEVNAFKRPAQSGFNERKYSPTEQFSNRGHISSRTRSSSVTSADEYANRSVGSSPSYASRSRKCSENFNTPSSSCQRSASVEHKSTTPCRIPAPQKMKSPERREAADNEENTGAHKKESMMSGYKISSRPPSGRLSNGSAKPMEAKHHSVNIRNLPVKESPSSCSRQNSKDAKSLLFGYTPIRRSRMRISTECADGMHPRDSFRGSIESSDASSSGSVSSITRDNSRMSPVIPSINVQHDSDAENICLNNNTKTHSLVNSPIAHLGRPRSDSNTPVFHKRLGELGALRNVDPNDALSPEHRRLASESHFPSMEKLRMSMNNLTTMDHSQEGEERPTSPQLQKFRSRAPQYRSFNLKKTTDKQITVLERLNGLREQLRHKNNFQENRTGLSRVGSMASVRNGH